MSRNSSVLAQQQEAKVQAQLLFNDHFIRVREGMNDVYGLSNLSRWIEKYTTLNDEPWSFKNYEFQPYIIDDPIKDLYVVKCAQVGLSEIFARYVMAACATQRNFTVIWTFPTSTDAEKFTKARLDPLIQGSTALKMLLSKSVDGVDMKKFGKNTFAYIRGTISDTGALSVPADMVIHDEYDRSDMDNVSVYVSRLQNKKTKMRRVFSTPTVAKYGIDKESRTSRRHRQMWKCSHCNHHFLPDFETNVHIPGWDRPKKEINKSNIKDIAWEQATLLCPNCLKVPDPDIRFREWVVENNNDNYPSKTIFVSPFCAPMTLKTPELVRSIINYDKWSEFQNQALGLTAEDGEENLTETEVRTSIVHAPLESSELHSLGIDVGNLYHLTIGRQAQDGSLLVVHRESCHYSQFQEVKARLSAQYRVISTVMDLNPHTPVVKALTDFDPNAYGAEYVDIAQATSHYVKETEEDPDKAQEAVRTVKINRSYTFDEIMYMFKMKKIIVHQQEDYEAFVSHLMSMKRVNKFDKYQSIVYRWVKTDGVDHWHHSLLYMYIATKLRGMYNMTVDATPNLVTTFKLKDQTPSLLTSLTGSRGLDGVPIIV